MKQSTTIRDMLIEAGFSREVAEMACDGLQSYVLCCKRQWRQKLLAAYICGYYPWATAKQTYGLLALFNHPDREKLFKKLTGPKIKAEKMYYV